MSGFSGVLQLTDLDDFITPSQECVMPTEIKTTKTGTGAKITIGDDGDYFQLANDGSAQKLQKVEITLADCLACSGCITSAESVLITQQSQEELLKIFEENKALHQTGDSTKIKLIIVSLSVQPIISLAIRYNLSVNECAAKLAGYFKSLGADMVIDMTCADDFALIESQREFLQRYRAVQSDGVKNVLPMLASSCPGWVCYAEKTHGSYILPYIASTKSPQQIMGSLLKNYVREKHNGRQIYHVTVMPCYDKKLEAARDDFFDKIAEQRDVDCVITAIEIEQMLMKDSLSLENIQPGTFSEPWSSSKEIEPCITRHIGSGSGGYAESIFKYAAKELFNVEVDKVEFKQLRNPDFRETILEIEGKVVLRFAIANGFRNIQNLVQKLKRSKSQYHYVEVMACPSGCLNGGAQVRPKDGKPLKELTTELENLYGCLPLGAKPDENLVVKQLYDAWLGGIDSDKANSVLHTEYHAIVKANTALNIKW